MVQGSFKDLCEKLDKDSVKMPWAVAHYSDLYPASSGLMHGDIIGVESQVDSSGYNAAVPPSDTYVTEALMSGHLAMVMALASYASIARLAKAQTYGDELLVDYQAVWGEGSRERKEAKEASISHNAG